MDVEPDPEATEAASSMRRTVGEDPAAVVEGFVRVIARHHRHQPDLTEELDAYDTLPAADQRRLLAAVAARYRSGADPATVRERLLVLAAELGREPGEQPLAKEAAARLAEVGRSNHFWRGDGYGTLARAELAAGGALDPSVVATFRRTVITMGHHAGEEIASMARQMTEPVLNVGEEWAERAMADVGLRGVLEHARTATASKPSAAWDEGARTVIEAAGGADAVRDAVLSWLALVGRPRTLPLVPSPYGPDANNAFDPYNATALRGLAWLLSLLPARQGTPRALAALVETALKKAPGLGPRNPKVANAGVIALSRIDGEEALAELARLALRVSYKATGKLVDQALETRAGALGMTREEVEELAVPTYGLSEVGRAEYRFGEATALLEVHAGRAVLS
ncbi:hypothetical protein [Streptomyces sp. NPDC048638]